MSNVCKHGQLARVCLLCEQEAEIIELEKELKSFIARSGNLEQLKAWCLAEIERLKAETERRKENDR